ncbi:MAG: bifunctional demethylmenaquinone methyltransferase/2-methoxy-6-polyprenyl-1,4-benzoquinol methylase UbiE [Xanthomonadales bacterium]|nr:bifunctional demethylmenaquinone methyltransferase/2-methoxy-6-polyprenyl-1,4-benzoquinol methylase UbiE [Xanthomonadales bacterium]
MSDSERQTHFGYRQVKVEDKAKLVGGVFSSVAGKYDLMNDLMSMGVHRLWKRHFIHTADLRPGQRVLDLAGGTGDIAALAARKVGAEGRVVLSDINREMLVRGRDRMYDEGLWPQVQTARINAEALPFPDNSFDCITIAFGLRNVTFKERALAEMHRVLDLGGQALILEFSKVRNEPLSRLYDTYSFQVLPRLGKLIAGDADSYQYLAESIRKHPDQQTLATMMEAAGFGRVSVRNLSAGIVAVHRGWKV